MKKLVWTILVFLLSININGQGLIILDENDNDITFGTMIVRDDADVGLIKASMFFHNASENTMQVLVRKIEIDLLEGTYNTFCWNGACFPPFVYEAETPIVLGPGETSGANDFYGEYMPNEQSGFSIIMYEFFSPVSCFETVTTTVVYATNGVPFVVFNINDGADDVAVDQSLIVTSDIALKHVDGSDINDESLPDLFIFKTGDASGSDVAFDAVINQEHTEITITPREDLEYSTTYFFEVLPLMGFEGEVSEARSINFTTHSGTNEPVVSFNVVDGADGVAVDHVFEITSNQSMWHADGTDITHENLPLLINFKEGDGSGADVAFNATINEEHTIISVSPVNNLAYNTQYFLELLPVMGVDGDISEAQSITFKTETETYIETFADQGSILSDPMPNPAVDRTRIHYSLETPHANSSIRVFSLSGSLIKTIDLDSAEGFVNIDTSQMHNGIYFYSLVANDQTVETRKLIISK